MERDGSLLDDYVLSLRGRCRGRASASCRPPRATPTTTWCASTAASPPAARPATCRCSAATRARAASRTTSPRHLLSPGSDLRRRRQRREHARRLARARARRDPAQGLAAGHRAVRALGRARCAGSSRRSAPSTARPRPVRGLGLLPYSNCVHYDAEPARRAEYHRAVADGMRGGFAAEDGVALHFRGTRLERVVSSRPDGSAYQVESTAGRASRETRLEVRYLGAAERPAAASARGSAAAAGRARPRSARRSSRSPREPPARRADARSARSSRWAAAASRWSPPTRCSTTSCSSLAARDASRGSCSCPPPRATPRAQINAFKARFAAPHLRARAPLPVPPARDHAAAARRSCSSRTSSTSGGGSMRNLLAIWRAHGLDALLIEAWEPGTVLAGLSAGAMCWFQAGVTRSSGPPEAARGARPARGLADRPRRRRARAPARVAGAPCATARCPGGWALDDGVGLLFRGRQLERIVSSRPGAGAQRVDAIAGELVRRRLEPELCSASGARDGARRARRGRRGAAPRAPAAARDGPGPQLNSRR